MHYFAAPAFYVCIELDTTGRVISASIQNKKPTHPPIGGAIYDALHNYFVKGRPLPASLISPNIQGTPFQKKVWSVISSIPFGKTLDYKSIARKLGSPLAYRAVGTACGKNPVALFIPCHRVVRTHGEDFGYSWGKEAKKWLLEFESAQ
jgi:methylated-DNA-[protein]-cysteine S-methyltransferase